MSQLKKKHRSTISDINWTCRQPVLAFG